MPSGSTCVLGTKCKHAFIILTLNLFPKMSFNGELWNRLSKGFETFFFADDTKIFTALAVIEPTNVKWCKFQFRAFLFQEKYKTKNPNTQKKSQKNYGTSFLHMKPFSFLLFGQITRASLIPDEIFPFLCQCNFWILSFSLFHVISSFSIFSVFPSLDSSLRCC